ncbi:hypothetical protein H4F05_08480 [Vibrio cholerae]
MFNKQKIDSGDESINIQAGRDVHINSQFQFSLEELKAFLNESQTSLPALSIKYLVSQTFDDLIAIANRNLEVIPVMNPLLVENNVFTSLQELTKSESGRYRDLGKYGNNFNSVEDYLKEYPEAEIVQGRQGRFPYFDTIRSPEFEELEKLSEDDPLTRAMLDHKVHEKFPAALIGTYEHGCWGVPLIEEYILRGVWGVFLTITNNSDTNILFEQLESETHLSQTFESTSKAALKSLAYTLPRAPIKPNETVVIPVSILITPIGGITTNEISRIPKFADGEWFRELSHQSGSPNDLEEMLSFGTLIAPKSISFQSQNKKHSVDIHDFDITNMYTINRAWQCGSCPHLFFTSDQTVYIRELLPDGQNTTVSDSFTVPENVKQFTIAELEDETTYIDSLYINDVLTAKSLKLDTGDSVSFFVSSGDTVRLQGRYLTHRDSASDAPFGTYRNSLINDYLNSNRDLRIN